MAQVMVSQSNIDRAETFEQQATEVLHRLRASLSVLIGSVPNVGELRKATDLKRALSIGSTLAWQVYKLAHARDPLTEASSVPGAGGMKRLFDAAAQHGVPAEHIADSAAAIQEFDELVKVHAGDRTAFDSMISSLTREGSEVVDAQQKRAAFRANSHLWGVQARTRLACYIYQPNKDDPQQLDVAVIRGLVGLRRLRRGASWTIARLGVSDDDGQVRHPVVCEPLDSAGEVTSGVPLLRDFCSQPLPMFRRVPAALGMINVQLEGESVGNKSAITCFVGDVSRAALELYQDEHNQGQTSQALVRTPCEVLILDVLVKAGTFGEIAPDVTVYGDHHCGDATAEGRECDILPLRESVAYIGKGPSFLQTLDVPRYPEMAQYAFDRLGWAGGQFDVYRCRVEYPVMPSSVAVRFELPEKP